MNRLRHRLPRLPHWPALIGIMLVFVAGFALGSHTEVIAAQGHFTQPPGTETLFEPLWQVYNTIHNQYVDPNNATLNDETLVDGALKGMVEALGDQYSGYMTPAQFPLLSDDLSGVVEGIGVVISDNAEAGGIEVVNVLEGTPAEAAGIQVGDIFAAVDDEDVLGFSQIDLATKVRGPAGSSVSITMLRGDQRIDFTLTRARIDVPNIESRVIENTHIGYIKLNQFTADARHQIDDALNQLDPGQLDGLILDLRGNPGGLLTSAIDIASAFLKDGTVLIEDFGDGREQVYNADGSYRNLNMPLVLLVDGRSASASELVAGALQDHGLATIVGDTTFGKGTVQNVQGLVNGGGLRLTIARWLTPNRHWIHGQGITPDVIVKQDPETTDKGDDPQLAAAIEQIRSPLLTPLK